jgi:hypothetical protein
VIRRVPFELKIEPGDPFARVRGWGKDDFAATLAGLRAVGEDERLPPGMPILLDVRELDYLATPPEVSAFAAPDGLAALFQGRATAIVVRRGAQFGVTRVFAAKVEGTGTVVEVFAEPVLAESWLRARR